MESSRFDGGFLQSTSVSKYSPYRFKEDLQIPSKTPITDILRVKLHDLFKVCNFRPSADLPHAGDAGLAGEPRTMMELIFFPLIDGRRAGAYETHLAHQDVEELRKFVETGTPNKITDAGLFRAVRKDFITDNPRIPVELEHHSIFDAIVL